MAGGATHADDDVIARGGSSILGEIAQQVNPVMTGGLKAEGGGRPWQRQIIVNGFRNVSDANGTSGPFVNLAGGKSGVIATDADQGRNPETLERSEHVLHAGG